MNIRKGEGTRVPSIRNDYEYAKWIPYTHTHTHTEATIHKALCGNLATWVILASTDPWGPVSNNNHMTCPICTTRAPLSAENIEFLG